MGRGDGRSMARLACWSIARGVRHAHLISSSQGRPRCRPDFAKVININLIVRCQHVRLLGAPRWQTLPPPPTRARRDPE